MRRTWADIFAGRSRRLFFKAGLRNFISRDHCRQSSSNRTTSARVGNGSAVIISGLPHATSPDSWILKSSIGSSTNLLACGLKSNSVLNGRWSVRTGAGDVTSSCKASDQQHRINSIFKRVSQGPYIVGQHSPGVWFGLHFISCQREPSLRPLLVFWLRSITQQHLARHFWDREAILPYTSGSKFSINFMCSFLAK